jgi:hypothetical protein
MRDLISDNWYVLYEGESEDGRGVPSYAGRTYSPKAALAHWEKGMRNPHSIGRVDRITDNVMKHGMTGAEIKADIEAYMRKHQSRKSLFDKKPVIEPKPVPKPDDWGGFA